MKRALKVFYGIGKINKIQKKAEIAVFFENGNNNPDKNIRMLSRWIKVVYVRNQTDEEMEDAEFKDRMFTKYNYFIDEKPFYGDVEKALLQNFHADSNHVPEKTREEIRDKLRKEFYAFYNRKPIKREQLELEFSM